MNPRVRHAEGEHLGGLALTLSCRMRHLKCLDYSRPLSCALLPHTCSL